MRKLLSVIGLVLIMSGASNGAVSEDMSVYVRRDVFDAKMEAFMNEIRGEFQVMNAKLESLSRRVDDNYQKLNERIDSIHHSLELRIGDLRENIYWLIVLLGIIICLPIVQKIFQSVKESRPTVTLEDVKRLIAENNAELLKTLRP
ncbi:MAG: hypothetical protein IJQ08_09680 [Synergistaceae bacterium]|nr:hypothetical protein [Synergistaceae bacterium]